MISIKDWQNNISRYAERCKIFGFSLIICAGVRAHDSITAPGWKRNQNWDYCEMQTIKIKGVFRLHDEQVK